MVVDEEEKERHWSPSPVMGVWHDNMYHTCLNACAEFSVRKHCIVGFAHVSRPMRAPL